MTTVARICSNCGKLHRVEEPEFHTCGRRDEPATMVIGDIEPVYNPPLDRIITSRSELREVRARGFEEVGNEKPKFMK